MKDQLPITIALRKTENGLVYDNTKDSARQSIFIDSLLAGTKVNVTYEIVTNDVSYAQISKLHKCIRSVAEETGVTFLEIKKEIKKRSGLILPDGELKSFADCSKQEISDAIKTTILVAENIGINLNSY